MTVFGDYSQYYDLLYNNKDYNNEAEYISKLIKDHKSGAENLLELGCGTGKHAELLACKGFSVTGVDLSENMLKEAKKRKNLLSAKIQKKLDFYQGDITKIRINKKFDAVISLFHVISYQTTNEQLNAAFATAAEHLRKGGLFVFDCWYGPAVLAQMPAPRLKSFENDSMKVIRVAEPLIYPNKNTVDVNYTILIQNIETLFTKEIKETHSMRYLFKPEIDLISEKNGFKIINTQEWLTGKDPGFDTWGVCFIGEKL